MANPLIRVLSALYGSPEIVNGVVDVTTAVQGLFDVQYSTNNPLTAFHLVNISSALLNVADPAVGHIKMLTVAYNIPGAGPSTFARGGQDGQDLMFQVAPLCCSNLVTKAYYGTATFGLDLTNKVAAYLADPGNSRSFVIGSADFCQRFCGNSDPAPRVQKFFWLTYCHSLVGLALNVCGSDGQTIDVSTAYVPPNQNWMANLATTMPAFANSKLRNMCFPATHDSGTYHLEAQLTQAELDPWLVDALGAVRRVTDTIDVIPFISHYINPVDWAYDAIFGVMQDLATSTRANIRQQLNDGMRCLDLRIYYNYNDPGNPFYTYHNQVGVPLSNVLSEVAFFITDVAPAGEIVYLTLGHYHDDETPGNGFTPEQLQELSTLIWLLFPDRSRVFGPQDAPPHANGNLFDCTYADVVTSSGTSGSKAILVVKNPLQADQTKFWLAAQYSPPDAGGSSLFTGSYTNTVDVGDMIATQQDNSTQAKSANLPFALYLTLTPGAPGDSTAIVLIAAALQNAILVLAAWVLAAWLVFIPYLGEAMDIALPGIVTYLAALVTGKFARYSSLGDLSSQVFNAANSTVAAMIQNNFSGPTHAAPTFIYMDYYENQTEQNSSGQGVAQVVEVAKAICLSNL